MNPIPQTMPPAAPVGAAYAELLMLIGVLSLAAIFGLMFWSLWRTMRERVRLFCPVQRRWARVLFGLDAAGRRADVVRCSVFGRGAITCGKACLHPGGNTHLAAVGR